MSPTQQDVANKLGVSREWVSRALSGDAKVSAASRAKVEAAAREVGYLPQANAEARSLAAKRHGGRALTHTLGIWHFENTLTYYSTLLLAAFRETARRHGQEILLLHRQPSAGWERVDGIVGHSRPQIEGLGNSPLAVPFVGVFTGHEGHGTVEVDDEDGARRATQHLLDLGHRRIGYLLYVDPSTVTMAQRLRGYQNALCAAGIEPRAAWQRHLIDYGDFLDRGRRNMAAWLEDGFRETGITALLVQNDGAAIGAMQVLQDAGWRVPRDISIVGFDGTEVCEMSSPRLTSMGVPLRQVGELAVEMLLRQIADDSANPESVRLQVELQVRDSTGPPSN